MNNQVIMDNYLLVLKSTVEVYIHGTLEASNEKVKALLKQNLNQIIDCQENTYNIMTTYGWYTTNNVDRNIICETINKLKNNN